MNRSTILVIFGLVACGTPQKPHGPHDTGSGSSNGSDVDIVDDWSAAQDSQLAPSPVGVRGEQIVFATSDQLEFIDAMTLKRVDSVQETYRSICVLPGGRLLGFANHQHHACEIDVFEGTTIIASPSLECSDGARLLAAAPAEVYVGRARESLELYRLADGGLRKLDFIALDERARNGIIGADQSISLGDGRIIVPVAGDLQVYEPGKATQTYVNEGTTAHVAAGSNGRIWYSVWNRGGDGRIEKVMLARLAERLPIEATVSVAPARVTHMASGESGALAMLLLTVTGTTAIWTLVYLEDNGNERWRAVIDDDIVRAVGVNLNLAFVAVTAKRVVLATDKGVYGWDAATGQRIR